MFCDNSDEIFQHFFSTVIRMSILIFTVLAHFTGNTRYLQYAELMCAHSITDDKAANNKGQGLYFSLNSNHKFY